MKISSQNNNIRISNFDNISEFLNGVFIFSFKEPKQFGELRKVHFKHNIGLSLWYDFNNKLYGGRFFNKDYPLRTYALLARGSWSEKKDMWEGYWFDVDQNKRFYNILIDETC